MMVCDLCLLKKAVLVHGSQSVSPHRKIRSQKAKSITRTATNGGLYGRCVPNASLAADGPSVATGKVRLTTWLRRSLELHQGASQPAPSRVAVSTDGKRANIRSPSGPDLTPGAYRSRLSLRISSVWLAPVRRPDQTTKWNLTPEIQKPLGL